MDQESINYLEQYITLTEGLQQKIEEYAALHGFTPEVCAYYEDRDDFVSDWTAVGYTKKQALDLLRKNTTKEFMALPDKLGIIRFSI